MVFLLVEFYLCPSHKLRLAYGGEAVELLHDGKQTAACRLPELAAKPLELMAEDGGGGDGVDVPCHVEKQLEVVGGGLKVVHVGYPQPSGVVVEGLPHLVADESRLCG